MASSTTTTTTHQGGCRCKRIAYTLTGPPIYAHCCHCRNCQKSAGSAFATNAIIEADRIAVTSADKPETNPAGLAMCAHCGTGLWLTMKHFGDGVRLVRVGTLDDAENVVPDAHFFTRSKHPWVTLPEGAKSWETMPGREERPFWKEETADRLKAVMGKK